VNRRSKSSQIQNQLSIETITQNRRSAVGGSIFIPQNTWHYVKVTSAEPLKVLSIQAPNFDGKDRVLK